MDLNEKKNSKIHSSLRKLARAVSFLLVFVFSYTTFAWLSTLFSGKEEIPFNAGTTPPLTAHMWMYNTKLESTPGWEEKTISCDKKDDEIIIIPSVIEDETVGSQYKYEIKSLHLGTINNLVRIEKDNTLYFCFEIDPVENGTEIELNISQPDDYLKIYEKSNETDLSEQITEVKDLNANSPLLQYKYALSNVLVDPVANSNAFNTLSFSDSWTTHNKNTYQLLIKDITEKGISLDDTCYLYLQVTPSLMSFARTAIILFNIMPCEILMDWDWEITVH